MDVVIFLVIFIFGTFIGSFLNVVIYRFNTGKSIARGRSICMSCNKTLHWHELVPVLSFLMQGGRCSKCSVRISYQYPLVELATGLIFAFLAYHFSFLLSFDIHTYVYLLTLYMFLMSLLIVITVYDIRHKIIPDKLVYMFVIVSFISIFFNTSGLGPLFVRPDVWDIAAGPLLALPFALLWLISKGRWMGLGDAKLILGIGFMLGLSQGIVALVISFWIGAIVSLLMLIAQRTQISLKTEIPFAPFLVLGVLITFFCNFSLSALASWFTF